MNTVNVNVNDVTIENLYFPSWEVKNPWFASCIHSPPPGWGWTVPIGEPGPWARVRIDDPNRAEASAEAGCWFAFLLAMNASYPTKTARSAAVGRAYRNWARAEEALAQVWPEDEDGPFYYESEKYTPL